MFYLEQGGILGNCSNAINRVAKVCMAVVLLLVISVPTCVAQADEIDMYLKKAADFRNAENNDSALIYAERVILLCREKKDTLRQLRAMRTQGKALLGQKKPKEAAAAYFAALNLCNSEKYEREAALLYGEVGYTYIAQDNNAAAKIYYRKEIDILRRLYGDDSIGNQLINLSVTHQSLNEFDSARAVLDIVGKIVAANKDSSMRAYYLFNMGAFYTRANKPDSAKNCYLQAYDLWKALGNERQLFRVTFNLGYYAHQKKNYKEAIKYYKLSEAAASKYGFKREISHVYGTMGESYAEMGDYKNAYDCIHKYAVLNDSFNKEDVNSYVLKLDKQFEAEKSQQIIQQQQLALKTANLEVQQQENTILIVVIVALVLLAGGAGAFVYVTFRGRVRKKVEEAKGRFFANVAHEIRTPLSMIKGPLELLQEQVKDERMQAQLDIAARSTQRLNDLISQMLDISKIDAVKYTLFEHVGNLSVFAAQLFIQYEAQARARGVLLKCEADADVRALFDKDALEKVMNNLVGNAIKYTPEGKVAGIEVIAHEDGASVALRITVWDSGEGIDKEEQGSVFDRFYRSEVHQKAGVKGTGIGLALVKELVDLMNGEITLESSKGKGAVFTVTCKLASVVSELPTGDEYVEGKPIVLLVEDDAEILGFNKAMLVDEGYNVVAVADGERAVNYISKTLPDIVVTDLMMPGKSGLELLSAIRGNDLYAHIPVVVLSAKLSQEARTQSIAAGAQVYLSKPFSPAELKEVVKTQLELMHRHKMRFQLAAETEDASIEQRYSGTDPFTKKCYETINEHLDDAQFSVEKLAALMNVNRSHFQRKIKTLTGYSPSELIRIIRLEHAKEMLIRKEGNITEIAYAAGFTSQSYFTKCFSEQFGYPPSEVTNRK